VLQIAPSGYRRYVAQQRNPALRCTRAKRDDMLNPEIKRVWQANMQVYGADKVWRQLNRTSCDHIFPLHIGRDINDSRVTTGAKVIDQYDDELGNKEQVLKKHGFT
jgi:hypothetical protein